MKRRKFIALFGGAVAWPVVMRAQQLEQGKRLGILLPYPQNDREAQRWIAAFIQGLRDSGWTEGGNIQIEYRWTGADVSRIRNAAAELIGLKPDAILVSSPLVLAPLLQMTSVIPLVFVGVTDPVGSGFVASLARPGGNSTGFTVAEFGMGGKMLEALKKIAPQLNRVGLIYTPMQVPQVGMLAAVEAVAPSLGVQVSAANAGNADQLKSVIEGFGSEPGTGLIVLPNPITVGNRDLIIALTARQRLPAVYPYSYFVRDGGLMSYGSDVVKQYRQAASYVNQILRGASPADLPIQNPTKYELVINLKTAKTLGLTVPPSLLATADELIE